MYMCIYIYIYILIIIIIIIIIIVIIYLQARDGGGQRRRGRVRARGGRREERSGAVLELLRAREGGSAQRVEHGLHLGHSAGLALEVRQRLHDKLSLVCFVCLNLCLVCMFWFSCWY